MLLWAECTLDTALFEFCGQQRMQLLLQTHQICEDNFCVMDSLDLQQSGVKKTKRLKYTTNDQFLFASNLYDVFEFRRMGNCT